MNGNEWAPHIRLREYGKRRKAQRTVIGAKMTTAKERIVEIIQQQPDDSSYEEILRELAFARMIDRGLEDSRSGRTLSNEEMERRIRTWQR
jgi:predicted transcriptional regulator